MIERNLRTIKAWILRNLGRSQLVEKDNLLTDDDLVSKIFQVYALFLPHFSNFSISCTLLLFLSFGFLFFHPYCLCYTDVLISLIAIDTYTDGQGHSLLTWSSNTTPLIDTHWVTVITHQQTVCGNIEPILLKYTWAMCWWNNRYFLRHFHWKI